MTYPYDTPQTEDDLDQVFGRLEHEPPADFVAHEDEPAPRPSQLPQPICALDAPPAAPVNWVVEDLFTSGDVGLIVGDGGSFKSSASLHIAAAVAGGYKVFDRFATCGPAPVLICSAEDPDSVIQMRLEAFVRGQDWSRVRTLANVHYFALAGIRLKDVRWKRHLTDVVRELSPAMVVLDPFVDLSGLEEENSNSEASTVMNFARVLARESRASIPFVHHATKSAEGGRTQSRIRGATVIANASRGTLFFEFTDAGVVVEQLKMTYAPKIPAFVLTRDIAAEPTNKAMWITARLATANPSDARATRAEHFVLSQVIASPGILNSRGVREAAKGSGIWPTEIDKALKTAFAKGFINFEPGPRKEKNWYATEDGKVAIDRVEPVSTQSKTDCVDCVEAPTGQSNGTGGDRVSLTETHTRIAPASVPPVSGPKDFGVTDQPAWEPGDDPMWNDDEIEP